MDAVKEARALVLRLALGTAAAGVGAVLLVVPLGWFYVWATTGHAVGADELWSAPVRGLVVLSAVGALFAPLSIFAAFFMEGPRGRLAVVAITVLLAVLWILARRGRLPRKRERA